MSGLAKRMPILWTWRARDKDQTRPNFDGMAGVDKLASMVEAKKPLHDRGCQRSFDYICLIDPTEELNFD